MSDYEHTFSEQASQEETRLSNGILASGLQPELLAELPLEDAKFMLRSVLKALGTLAHPDYGTSRSVFGLDIQDINNARATITNADNSLFASVLSKLNSQSALLAERSANAELIEASEASYDQANALGLHLISKERPAALVTGSIAVTKIPERLGTDEEAPLNQELLILQLEDGVVCEAIVAPAWNVLASKLSIEAQKLVHSLRPDLDTDEQLVYIDTTIAKKTGLPESWCRLVTAKSKVSGKKAAGVKIYELANTAAYSESQLVGTKVFGRYTPPSYDTNLNPFMRQLQDRSILTPDITRLGGHELSRLLTENHVTLPHNPEELISSNQQPLVFVKQVEQGVNSTGYIVQNPVGLHVSS